MVQKYFIPNLLVATAYFIAGQAGLLLAIPPSNAAAVWPAAGVAITAIIIYGPRVISGILIGGILVQTTSYLDAATIENIISSFLIGTIISIGATSQAWMGAKLTHRLFEQDHALLKERSILLFCLLAGPVSCVISASVGIATLWFRGVLSITDIPLAWSTWWIGDSIGVLVFCPILLCLFGRPRILWKQRIASVALPLCILSSIAFIAFEYSNESEMKYIEEQFERNAQQFTDELRTSIEHHIDANYELKEFFDNSDDVSAEKFSSYVRPKISRHPEIQALSWLPMVLHKDRVNFEEHLGAPISRQDPNGNMVRSQDEQFYFPITYIEPFEGNKNAFGFDIRNRESTRNTADVACLSGKIAVTEGLKLVQEMQNQVGIIFYAPIYMKNVISESKAICDNLSGLVGSVFRLENEVINILERSPNLKLLVSIENKSSLIYSNLPEANKAHSIPSQFQFKRIYEVPIANQQWQLTFTPAIGFISHYSSWIIWLIIVGGLLISGLSGIGLMMLTGRTLRTEELIQSRTKELNSEIKERKEAEKTITASEEKYRTLIEHSPYCIHQINLEGQITSMNLAGLKMFNKEDELNIINVSYLDTVRDEDRERISKLMDSAFSGEEAEFEFSSVNGLELRSNFVPIFDETNKVDRLLGITQDITESKEAEKQLNYQASHDSLTKLVNRVEFERRVVRLLATTKQDMSVHALCFMDLDQFKVVNDTCGHMAGDEMLRQLASLLLDTVRHRDTLARLGGDEFGVLIEHCTLDDAYRVASTLLAAIQDYQFVWEDQSFKVGVSIGLVVINEGTFNLSELLKQADAACYRAKDLGRNRIHVYQTEDIIMEQRHGEMQWVSRIHRAIEEDRFCLYAQAIVPLNKNPDLHYELLIRMVDEQGEIIPPGAFLPAAERYNLISMLDRWVVKNAFISLSEHPAFLKQVQFISINLSGQSLVDETFQSFVMKLLEDTNIDANKICFEITETAAISNMALAFKFISALKDKGCRFALDDFGSGLSSFAYLKNLPIDYLKIDGMFVKDITEDPIDRAMVKSINEIGHVMGMQTIAEFVENDEIKGMLREIGVDYGQGYGIHKPQPFDDILKN